MAAPAAPGHIEEFAGTDSWQQYAERLGFHFQARGITDESIKRAILLSGCGKETYALIRSLSMPKAPGDLSYEELISKVQEHFTPKPSEIVQRFRFHKRDQTPTESIAEYVADLRRLSEHCGFGETLDLMLRDRVVCGLKDASIQRRLLAEPELTLQKALSIAVAAETAGRDAMTLRADHLGAPTSRVNSVSPGVKYDKSAGGAGSHSKPQKKPPHRQCFRCGEAHSPDLCRHREAQCRYCKKQGHLERVCFGKARDLKTRKNAYTHFTGKAKRETNIIESEASSEQPNNTANNVDVFYDLNNVTKKTLPGKFLVDVTINRVTVKMEVDSGAACTLISEETFHKLWSENKPTLQKDQVALRTWTKEPLEILGTLTVDIDFRNQRHCLPLFVMKGSGHSLLGRNWFEPLGIHFSGIHSMDPGVHFEDDEILQEVFADGLGMYTGPPVTVQVHSDFKPPLGELLLMEASQDLPLDAKMIGKLSRKDPIIARVMLWTLNGFPEEQQGDAFTPYLSRKTEFSTHKDCLLWGSRVVVPPTVRTKVLQMLHQGHPGIVRMKALARSYVWWPGMDKDIEGCVNQCEACQMTRNNPVQASQYTWETPGTPWSRLHVDFAGPYKGKVFFLVVDAYSKWLEVKLMSSMTAPAVITTLRGLFATHGLPDIIVSDNASVFTSAEYLEFLQKNGIRSVRGAPYHPATNGQVERYVQSTKKALTTLTEGDWSARLARYVFHQHVTPSTTTGVSPAELLMGRRLRTVFDRLHPSVSCELPSHPKIIREFQEGDAVYARNYTSAEKWTPARVSARTGPLSYTVDMGEGQFWRRHVDQLRRRVLPQQSDQGSTPPTPRVFEENKLPDIPTPTSRSELLPPPQIPAPTTPPAINLRRSTRLRTVPHRFGDYRVHHT